VNGLATLARLCAAALSCAALVAAAAPAVAAPREPLCDWLSGIGEAAEAQGAGDAGAAEIAARRALAARPRGPASARASAALGLALAKRAPAEAAEALEAALAERTMAARTHLAAARGEALLAAGDAPRAAALLGQAARATDLAIARHSRHREAEALLAAGLAAEAVPLLEALVAETRDDPRTPAMRLALARGLGALGDVPAAAGALHALWLEAPASAEARGAGATLEAWRAAGAAVPAASPEDRLARAERLLAGGWPEAALLEVDEAVRAAPPDGALPLAEALRASAILALGRHEEAARIAAPLADAQGDAEPLRRAAQLVLARAAARAGRVEEASRRYAEVARLSAPIPGLPEWRQRDVGDEAAYLAAWLFYDAGDFARAADALTAFARANRRSRRVDDARWFAAWSLYRLGRGAEASRALERLARGPLADASAYWRARIARAPARQRVLYRAAVRANGDGWYAMLARARLAALGDRAELPPRLAAAPPQPLPQVAEPGAAARLAVAVELLGLGLREEALAELGELPRTVRLRAAAPLVAQLAAFAGDAQLPFRMARDHLGRTRRALRWAYPEPYPELLPARARALGVEPALLLATMRRESGFRPAVRSGAGAEGLLQIRPATAERISALLGVPPGAGARLADPEVNVTLGAHYLSLLLDRFGHPALALAAYNAGPLAAADWARARAGMPLDVWVESIPYRETRGYVKVVLAEWETYRALQGDPPAPVDPAWRVAPPPAGAAF
jgi:soluble lytic murein transglycosylase